MATKLATGGAVADIAPTQEQLESEAVSDQAVGTLPTKQFFAGERVRGEIEAAQDFLSFGTVGGDDEEDSEDTFFDFGDGSDDNDDEGTGALLGF